MFRENEKQEFQEIVYRDVMCVCLRLKPQKKIKNNTKLKERECVCVCELEIRFEILDSQERNPNLKRFDSGVVLEISLQ